MANRKKTSKTTTRTNKPFAVKDCALIAIATGKRAQNLKEMRDILALIEPGSIYYHFWGGLLRPRFDDPEYKNDFASWVYHALHDKKLAERLAVIDPTDFPDLEGLRQELVEEIEECLDEDDFIVWSRTDQQFSFITSKIVVFDTDKRLAGPAELAHALPEMSSSSVFYHFIDARRRTPEGYDDFRAWLYGFGDTFKPLCDLISNVDPYYPSLSELKDQLSLLFQDYFRENS